MPGTKLFQISISQLLFFDMSSIMLQEEFLTYLPWWIVSPPDFIPAVDMIWRLFSGSSIPSLCAAEYSRFLPLSDWKKLEDVPTRPSPHLCEDLTYSNGPKLSSMSSSAIHTVTTSSGWRERSKRWLEIRLIHFGVVWSRYSSHSEHEVRRISMKHQWRCSWRPVS